MHTRTAEQCDKQRMEAGILKTLAGICQSRIQILTNTGERFNDVPPLLCDRYEISLENKTLGVLPWSK